MMFRGGKILPIVLSLCSAVPLYARQVVSLFWFFSLAPASPKRHSHIWLSSYRPSLCFKQLAAEQIFQRGKDSAHYWNIDMRYGLNKCINIFLRQMKTEWELGIGWEAEGHLSQAAKPMWTTSSSGLFLPTLLPFLPLDFSCPPTAHVTGLFVSFGFDPCLPYFRVGFIKCLSGSFRAYSLSLSFETLTK